MKQLRLLARRYLSRDMRRHLARLAVWPPVGRIRFGDLRRIRPISSDYGNSRGEEIDRYYIECFLSEHRLDIHGRLPEVKHSAYATKFGQERVSHTDSLHKLDGNPEATIIADLIYADHEFDAVDPNYEMLVAVRAVKPG